ncbi:hypothetical protein NP493_364g01044 [Ridgeia piscesae]|uniref:ADP-ribosyl cyclase/cyclic ADP-ribose hydrolase n=1 Tax=Ridgeia piscesae TaxID=27915 RepID=A0AAD9L3I7_RIDPI|nr:hypothetical protein NP493_364g01044 [Ridgeia piscesae]
MLGWQLTILCVLYVFGVGEGLRTTPNIKQVFIGRCMYYYNVVDPTLRRSVNCATLWDKFSSAFRHRSPCDVTTDSYASFVRATSSREKRTGVVFWEDTYPFVLTYTDGGRRGLTIADTQLGYMADRLHWCGQVDRPGINFDDCPAECRDAAVEAYWGAVSIQFAREASGPVRVVLNASECPVFKPNSPFATYELPNILAPRIPHLHVYLLHEPGRESTEWCGGPSLSTLERLVTSRGVTYSCTDNPSDILHLLCVESPTAPQCQLTTRSLDDTWW